ncbi:MAG: CCA tRNA nucleotidyltransferase [bacterium]|nr:CCA tRNA nucleotidyltransferase [bacterium]
MVVHHNMTTHKLPPEVEHIFRVFQKAEFEIYAVGGCVRDLITGRQVRDWDFTTNATPEEILNLFPGGFYDNLFGTVGIQQENGEIYEVTTYRTEGGYSDRRHPDVVKWGKTLEEDLARRDFTINAVALELATNDPASPAGGQRPTTIIDHYGGQKDIGSKLIRAVGDPQERFAEDALRLLRAVRIATELGFLIEEKTFQAIKDNAVLIKRIAGERIKTELFKILASDFPFEGFTLLRSSGLLAEILPEVDEGFSVPQKSPGRHHIYDVGTHSLLSLKHCPSKDSLVRFATFLHDVGKPAVFKKDEKGVTTFYNHEIIGASIVRNIAERLAFSKKDREKFVALVRWHQFTVDELQTDSAIRRFIRRVGPENLKDIFDLRVGDRLGGGCVTATSWRLRKFMDRVIEVQKHTPSVEDLKVNGHDVMKELGTGPGPKVGEILNLLFTEITDDPTKNNREHLLERIKSFK